MSKTINNQHIAINEIYEFKVMIIIVLGLENE